MWSVKNYVMEENCMQECEKTPIFKHKVAQI
jgi:hypothetical protein